MAGARDSVAEAMAGARETVAEAVAGVRASSSEQSSAPTDASDAPAQRHEEADEE